MSPPVVVITPTIPWRKPACEAMLECLAKQTRLPDAIYLLLDEWEGPPPTIPEGLQGRIIVTAAPSFGGGDEILLADRLSKEELDPFVLFLDDDVLPPPSYIETMVAWQVKYGGIVQWWYNNTALGASSTLWHAGGVSIGRLRFFTGISDDAVARRNLTYGRCNDCTVAAWCWKKGISITQVSNPAQPLPFHPLATDARSDAKAHDNEYRRRQAWSLKKAWGWPASDTFFPGKAPPASGEIHVVIASVPWRVERLNGLLEEIHRQTLVPDHIHLILDNWPTDVREKLRVPNHLRAFTDLEWTDRVMGAGHRWSVLHRIPEESILISLDDDVILPRDFVARAVRAIETRSCAVAVGGYEPDRGLCVMESLPPPLSYEGPLICAAVGFFACEAKYLKGLHDIPNGEALLGILGDDEAAVSAQLWRNGCAIKRLDVPGIRFDTKFSTDPRSQYLAGGVGRCVTLRDKLRQDTGWPWPRVAQLGSLAATAPVAPAPVAVKPRRCCGRRVARRSGR